MNGFVPGGSVPKLESDAFRCFSLDMDEASFGSAPAILRPEFASDAQTQCDDANSVPQPVGQGHLQSVQNLDSAATFQSRSRDDIFASRIERLAGWRAMEQLVSGQVHRLAAWKHEENGRNRAPI